MLKHPVVLAGFFVITLLGIAAGVLTFADRGRHETAAPGAQAAATTQTAPADATAADAAPGAQTLRTTAVRTAPGDGSPVLGALPKDSEVDVDGRSSDSKWLRIVFPRGSDVRGWVDAAAIDLPSVMASLPVRAGEASVQAPALPTKAAQSGQAGRSGEAGQSASASIRTSNTTSTAAGAASTATSVPAPPTAAAGFPDLIVSGGGNDNGHISATVKNAGTGTATGTVVVTVRSNAGATLATTSAAISLKAGQSITIPTGYSVQGAARIILAVSAGGAIAESNTGNNELPMAVTFTSN